MPRGPRRVAESGHYHVVLKGNGKQVIFEDDADRRVFLDVLSRSLGDAQIVLLAWCLMSNHVHLLLSDPSGRLSSAMHSLATRYAGHFNSKTGHTGSVFDGRFKSIPVESDRQLLAAVRYIHDNPRKAGICPAGDYPWSSFGEYLGKPTLTDVSTVLDLVGGVDGFLALMSSNQPNGYCFRTGRWVSDDDALEVARAVLHPADPSSVKESDDVERGRILLALREAGLTIKQIERVTGIGRYAVERGILLAGGSRAAVEKDE